MRGFAPLLVALAQRRRSSARRCRTATWLGVVGISAGVLLVGLSRIRRDALHHRQGAGVRASPTPPSSPPTPSSTASACAPSGDALQLRAAAVRARRHAVLRCCVMAAAAAGRAAGARWAYMRAALAAGRCSARCASLGSYGIALWAMTRAPVAGGGGAARDLGAVRRGARHLAAEGALRCAPRRRHAVHRRRRDGAAAGVARCTRRVRRPPPADVAACAPARPRSRAACSTKPASASHRQALRPSARRPCRPARHRADARPC